MVSNNTKVEIMIKGAELSSKLNSIGVINEFGKKSDGKQDLTDIINLAIAALDNGGGEVSVYVDNETLIFINDVSVEGEELILINDASVEGEELVL